MGSGGHWTLIRVEARTIFHSIQVALVYVLEEKGWATRGLLLNSRL